jgi:hypothetical protein
VKGNVCAQIEHEFVEMLGVMILWGGFDLNTEYRRGVLEGLGKAYTKMTGKTVYQLVEAANERITKSGKKLVMT